MSHRVTRRRFAGVVAAGSAALAAGLNARAGGKARAASAVAELSGLDEYCQTAIEDWQVPGLALAVIRDGKLVLARGYGVRELGKDARVDENTVFPVASCTKSFTAAIVGKLVDQEKLRWDDPLGKHVPLLTGIQDGAVKPTIRHALQHRTGIPTANMLWRSGEFDGDEILRRVRFLKPVATPGEKFLYNNVMYLAAAKCAEEVSSSTWSDLVRSEFFEPLGMESSVAGSSQLEEFDNRAAPHATVDKRIKVIERYCPDVVAPAGAIHSTATDMAKWLMMHLGRGSLNGRNLLSPARIDEMQRPVEPAPSENSTKGVPKAPIDRYAMGWFVNQQAGKDVIEHSGTQSGFVSWMAMMPKERLGLVILSNHHQTGINYALRHWILDRLLGRPEHDWSTSVRNDFTTGWQKLLREAKAEFEAKRPPENSPSRPLESYVGNYESPLYGTIKVTVKANSLRLQFGTRFDGELKASQGDIFRAYFPNPRLDDWLLTFATTEDRIVSLRVQEAPWAPQWYDDRDDLGIFDRR